MAKVISPYTVAPYTYARFSKPAAPRWTEFSGVREDGNGRGIPFSPIPGIGVGIGGTGFQFMLCCDAADLRDVTINTLVRMEC